MPQRELQIYCAEFCGIHDFVLLKYTLPNICRNWIKNIDSIFKIVFMVLGKGGRFLDQFLAELKSHVE